MYNKIIFLNVGNKIFKINKQTILFSDSYLSSLIKDHNFENNNTIYIDRDPLCFPIILNSLRGYFLTKSQIYNIFKKSKFDKKEFYQILYEDILFYKIKSLINEFETLLYNKYPEIFYNINKNGLEEYEKNKKPHNNKKKEILFNKIQEFIDIINRENNNDEKFKLDKYNSLTISSSKNILMRSYIELEYYIEFDLFRSYFCTIFIKLINIFVLILYNYTNIDLRHAVQKIISNLRNNDEVLNYIFKIKKTINKLPLINFIFESIITLIINYCNS